ncbi:cytochrome P450 [Mycena polygramma]|nr:cytochrome P450 [Mycena polygramma]
MVDDTERFILLASLWIVYTLALLLVIWAVVTGGRALRRALHTTPLPGPTRSLRAFSVDALDIPKSVAVYGPVFAVPTGIMSKKIILCDPTAIAHFYASAPAIYRSTHSMRQFTKNLVYSSPLVLRRATFYVRVLLQRKYGPNSFSHRQALAPMFSSSAVQSYGPIFFSKVNKMKYIWKDALESRPHGMLLDVQHWMNSVVLDSLGVAGFGHDFESLNGNYCIVTAAFYALGAPDTNSPADIIFRLASTYPLLRGIPTARNRIIRDFQSYMRRIAGDMLERKARKECTGEDNSILGSLMKSLAEDPAGEFRLSHIELLGQNTLLFSGFETTAVSLSWLLVELARNDVIQDQVRQELQQLRGNLDLSKILKLPYLHSVVYEGLRLHPPSGDTIRVAVEDDVIPLSGPSITRSGDTITSIHVAKGTVVTVPIQYANTCEAVWGTGASKFDPARWWQDDSNRDFPGNRHLAFGDGPRTCIGAEFSLALMKVVLSVILSSFALSFPAGPETLVESIRGHPRVSAQCSELLMVVQSL